MLLWSINLESFSEPYFIRSNSFKWEFFFADTILRVEYWMLFKTVDLGFNAEAAKGILLNKIPDSI